MIYFRSSRKAPEVRTDTVTPKSSSYGYACSWYRFRNNTRGEMKVYLYERIRILKFLEAQELETQAKLEPEVCEIERELSF